HIDAFEAAAESLNEATSQSLASGHVDSAAAERLNQSLMQVERNWCDAAGIPGRPWFKHSVYAARYTYAHLELPGMTEAAEAGNWKVVGEQEQIIERELEKNTALLTHARADFMHKGVESAATPTAPQSNSPLNDDYAVYSAVIAHELKFIGGKLLVLENQTSTSSPERLALLTSGGGKESEEFNATVSAETLSDFGAKNKKPILLAPLLKLSLPYELRTNAELDVFFKKSGGGYPAFRKKFSGAQGIITLSRVGFNSGRNQALVYVGYNCGPLCGHGDLYLLTKLGTEWTIQIWTMLWIS
ncbi:MAG TPA: transferrin receptor-like dimerization domain-containing protein, partial [Candidatus Methylomirabilis sp.]|nr:transferrin receptor-like dimerization domain-containing protein [Candidatus Methylomirabilis sp.]